MGGGSGGGGGGRSEFLEKTKAAREERQVRKLCFDCCVGTGLQKIKPLFQAEKARGEAVVIIQCAVRGWLARIRVRKKVAERFDAAFPPIEEGGEVKIASTSLELYRTARLTLAFPGDVKGRVERLERMLRYIVASLDSDSPKISYIGVFLSKAHSVAWIAHVKQLTLEASRALAALTTESPTYHRRSAFLVLALISFTSTSTWALLKSPAMAALAPHMTSICKTVAGSLVAGIMIDSKKKSQ